MARGRVLLDGLSWLPWAMRPRGGVRAGVSREIEALGVRTLPLVAAGAPLVGLITAFQIAIQLERYGAETMVATGMGWFTSRELGPLVVALLIVARSSSRIGGELAAMGANSELDALRVMGLEPVKYLVAPRLLALLVVLPALTLVADAMIVLGAWLGHSLFLGLAASEFLELFRAAAVARDIAVGLGKAVLFALVIGVVASAEGLAVRVGGNIGDAAARAVSYTLVGVLVADTVVNAAFYFIPGLAC